MALADVPGQVVLIEQADSWSIPGLQAVDFVAWAFQRKQVHGAAVTEQCSLADLWAAWEQDGRGFWQEMDILVNVLDGLDNG